MFAQLCTVVHRIKKGRDVRGKRENCHQGSMVEVEENIAGGDKTPPTWSSTDSHLMAGGASTQKLNLTDEQIVCTRRH